MIIMTEFNGLLYSRNWLPMDSRRWLAGGCSVFFKSKGKISQVQSAWLLVKSSIFINETETRAPCTLS